MSEAENQIWLLVCSCQPNEFDLGEQKNAPPRRGKLRALVEHTIAFLRSNTERVRPVPGALLYRSPELSVSRERKTPQERGLGRGVVSR
jgi:hypothetical protein